MLDFGVIRLVESHGSMVILVESQINLNLDA